MDFYNTPESHDATRAQIRETMSLGTFSNICLQAFYDNKC